MTWAYFRLAVDIVVAVVVVVVEDEVVRSASLCSCSLTLLTSFSLYSSLTSSARNLFVIVRAQQALDVKFISSPHPLANNVRSSEKQHQH